MNELKSVNILSVIYLILIIGCNTNEKSAEKQLRVSVKEEALSYNVDSTIMEGFVAYDESSETKRPVVLIVHEWWGLDDYTKNRAKQLGQMGYLALAVDMYGKGQQADNPEMAGKLALPFYQDPEMAKNRFVAALNKIKNHPVADTNNIAAIGYCFGGAQVLNMARMGVKLKGVVSFHGNLNGVTPQKDILKAEILVCHGEADDFVPADEVATFKKQMDSIGAKYIFKSYPNATHAFTNPGATDKGKKFNLPIAYNAAADSASWNDMKVFFSRIFK